MKLILHGAMLAALLCVGLESQAQPDNATGIKITAKKYEFDPSTIRVKKGDHVRLLVTALDRDHGLKLATFNVEKKLPKGEEVVIEFTADQAGTFPFQCSVFCGLGHKRMKGELIVE
jgi:cytochrome c oxidase subunit 2